MSDHIILKEKRCILKPDWTIPSGTFCSLVGFIGGKKTIQPKESTVPKLKKAWSTMSLIAYSFTPVAHASLFFILQSSGTG